MKNSTNSTNGDGRTETRSQSKPQPDSPARSRSTRRLWVVVPAAGSGRRMGAERPKQYLELNGRRVIEHTLARLAAVPSVAGMVVALAPQDRYWQDVAPPAGVPVETVEGGAMRHLSVRNALLWLESQTADHDWVLVHDAARPCVRSADVQRLVDELWEDETGGLLAVPAADTLKRAAGDPPRAGETIPREGLWHALTPQMFRRRPLLGAIEAAMQAGVAITDEASAMEYCGFRPRLIRGARDNLKITTPEDLELAARYLCGQEEGA